MRIAIDLCLCQQANTSFTLASLAAVFQMAGNPDGHTLWIALSNQFPETAERLRAACTPLLPPERILMYDIPAPNGTVRNKHTIELIRENFFSCLGVDIVFTPGEAATADAAAWQPSANFISAVGISIEDEAAHALAPGVLAVEIGLDPAVAAQRAFAQFERAVHQRPGPPFPEAHPTLAWVVAQAPEEGSVDSRLLAELARYYDVHLILPELEAARQCLSFPLHHPEWIEQNSGSCKRIVYTVGNSERHSFMPALLARFPGIVILKDFFLEALFDNHAPTPSSQRLLFQMHGFTVLADELSLGLATVTKQYPLNKNVLDLATGVIVESPALITQAKTWYGSGAADRWRCIPALLNTQETYAYDTTIQACVDAIEAFTCYSPAAHYRALLTSLRADDGLGDMLHSELLAASMSIAANQPALPPRQLMIDVSALVQLDAKTGISRVVRNLLLALISAPPAGYRVEAVYGDGGNRRYRYARNFTLGLIGASNAGLEDAPIEQRAGDIFVGIDVAASITTQNAALIADMRNHGVQIYFLVHDILPVLMPSMFAYGTDTYFQKYLDTIARHSDGLLCTTRAGADILCNWIKQHPSARLAPLHIGYFHLGAEFDASSPSAGLPEDAATIFAAVAQRPTLLMVGTIEPRKAQAQALAAFELLWAQGVDVNLVVVGKPGWMVEPLIKRLKKHPQRGMRLFWLSEASDEMLGKLYRSCSALLAPSLGEGFGLPLIEAAQYGLPIIARRLTVFAEICGEHAFYFEGEAPHELANPLREWLALFAAGRAPPSVGLAWLSWHESARMMLACVLDQNWYRSLPAISSSL